MLAVTVSATTEGLPGPLDPPGAAAAVAARYRLICSQLDQPGLTVSLLSTLNPGQPLPVPGGASTLRRFAAAAELFTTAAAAVTPPDLSCLGMLDDLSGLGMLDDLLDGYGVLTAELATANAGRPLNGLLAAGQPLAMRTSQTEPDLVPADASTLAEVAVRLGSTPERLLKDNRGLRLAVAPSIVLPGIVALPADAALSRPLAVLAGDGPLTAAEVQAQHGCPAEAFAAANAAVLGVLQPGAQLNVAARTVTTAQHDTLNAVLGRLAAQGVSLSVAELLAANASTPLFRAGARVLLPPSPVTLSASGPLVGTFAAPVFELAVTLRLERPAVTEAPVTPTVAPVDLVTSAPDPVPAPVERADSAVPAPARGEAAFEPFVDACLVAVPGIRLATRTTASEAGAAPWAVAFDSQGISSVRLQPATGYSGARFLAPPPLYPEPLHFDAPISELTALGTLGEPTRQAFSGVDAERWARRFLTDLDRYLDAPFAALLSDVAPAALQAVRHDLADAIAAGAGAVLAPDLPDPAPAGSAGLSDARAALAAVCRSGSSTGYGSVAVQHSVAAVTRFEPAQAVQLLGVARVGGLPQPSTTDLSSSDGWSTVAVAASLQDGSRDGGQTSVAVNCDQVFHSLTMGAGAAAAGDRVELSFARPLTGDCLPKHVHAELGLIEIPIAQRLQPAPPRLLTVAAQPSWPGPARPTLRQAADWTFAVSYSHEHTAHDEVRVSICNPARQVPGSPDDAGFARAALPRVAEPNPALAVALARYLAVADQLAALLGWYAKPSKGADAAVTRRVRENALTTLTELTGAVAEAWAGHTEDSPTGEDRDAGTEADADGGSNGEECREYRLQACYTGGADGERLFDRLVVTADQPDGDWPAISWLGEGAEKSLTPGPVAAGQRSYTPARPIAAAQPLTFRLELAGLNAVSQQTARAVISVSRNAVLRAGMRTAAEFVLPSGGHTSNAVSPASVWLEPIALPGADVAQALQACFDTLFGSHPADGLLSLDISYSYLIGSPASPAGPASPDSPTSPDSPAPTDPSLRAEVPVASLPAVALTPDLAATVADAVENWRRQAEPPTRGGEWYFRLALMSPRPGEPPLLAFERLVFA